MKNRKNKQRASTYIYSREMIHGTYKLEGMFSINEVWKYYESRPLTVCWDFPLISKELTKSTSLRHRSVYRLCFLKEFRISLPFYCWPARWGLRDIIFSKEGGKYDTPKWTSTVEIPWNHQDFPPQAFVVRIRRSYWFMARAYVI